MGHHRLKLGLKHLFGIPCGLGSFLQKVIMLPPMDTVDPFWHPPGSSLHPATV